ncbi:MAG: lipase family protein [Streptococcaceae bacterium]|nr:lipase family protein [Streptococcaceae bacterium]
MNNLQNFNNIYANIAESSYNSRPKNFPLYSVNKKEKYLNFSENAISEKTGEIQVKAGKNLPNNGIAYLQPDLTLHDEPIKTTLTIPNPNGGYHNENYTTKSYQKGLLTDEKAGFNAYFVTDTPQLTTETKNTYLSIRGSDSYTNLGNVLNDWLANDANFALTNAYIPQAKLANQAIQQKVKDLQNQAPNAQLNITGHSLGTMISAQAVAKFYHDFPNSADRLGKVVLFDGPDVTQSLKNMGLSEEEMEKLGEKVTYYVNPFDLVSMLNRTESLDKQFGNVHVIVPRNFGTTFDTPSSHDFGAFQIQENGEFLVATKDFHPELLEAGNQLAHLLQETVSKLEKTVGVGLPVSVLVTALTNGINGLTALGFTTRKAKELIDAFTKEYGLIIKNTKTKTLKWDERHIPMYQQRIRSSSSAQKISLRSQLLQTVAQTAILQAEEYKNEITTMLNEEKEKVQQTIKETREAIYHMVQYLDAWEVEELLAEFTIRNLWDVGIEENTNKSVVEYFKQMEDFSIGLVNVSQHIQEVDKDGAIGFKNIMNLSWRN